MLSIPAKRSEPYNITPCLSAFIKNQYGDESGKFAQDVTSLQQTRHSAVSVVEPNDIGKQNILRYNHHLSFLVTRFSGYEAEIKFKFPWFDAYKPSFRYESHSLYYDWACVLWNLASFESVRGCKVERSSDEGIRSACKHFLQAAGTFDFIKTEITKNIKGGVSADLSDDGLDMVKNVRHDIW